MNGWGGMSTPVTTINLRAMSCSVANDVIEGGAEDDSANTLARCAATIPAGRLCSSTSDLVSGAAAEPSYDLVEMHFSKPPP